MGNLTNKASRFIVGAIAVAGAVVIVDEVLCLNREEVARRAMQDEIRTGIKDGQCSKADVLGRHLFFSAKPLIGVFPLVANHIFGFKDIMHGDYMTQWAELETKVMRSTTIDGEGAAKVETTLTIVGVDTSTGREALRIDVKAPPQACLAQLGF